MATARTRKHRPDRSQTERMGDSTGTWDPSAPAAPAGADLAQAAQLWSEHGDACIALLPDGLRQTLRNAMQLPRGALEPAIETFDAATLEALVRLFTCIEAEPGFEAGARSPVIPLARRLRPLMTPDHFSDLVRWIRDRSDNRFIPHGSLQDRLRA